MPAAPATLAAIAEAGIPFGTGSDRVARREGGLVARPLDAAAAEELSSAFAVGAHDWPAARWVEEAVAFGETVVAVGREGEEPSGFAAADFRCAPGSSGGKARLAISVGLKAVYVVPGERSSGMAGALREAIASEVAAAHARLARLANFHRVRCRVDICVAAECLSEGGARFAAGLLEACERAVSAPGQPHPAAGRTTVTDAIDYGDWAHVGDPAAPAP